MSGSLAHGYSRSARARATSVALTLACAQLAHPLGAQTLGRIEGTVADSVHSRPLAGATVSATPTAGARDTTYTATTDVLGGFTLAGLVPGRYAVTFASALLDSLEFGGPVSQVTVQPGVAARVELAIPSRGALVARACPGVALADKTGALLGLVGDADTERPLAGAQVGLAWSEIAIDTATHAVATAERSARATTDASGAYRFCGVPAGEWLLVQVQQAGRAGAVVRVAVPSATGVAVRNLSFSAASARALAAAADSSAATLPAGTATLAGTVRTEGGQPVAGAEVRVLNAAPVAHTDALGAFVLSSLPSGTLDVEVRQLGYGIARRAVELRAGQRASHDVVLTRVVALDSINVVAHRSRYPEFESRRREAVMAKFLDEGEIERLHVMSTADVIATIPGFRVVGQGPSAQVLSTRSSQMTCRSPVILVDNLPVASINDVPPAQLGAMEFYPGAASAPMTHRSPCGTIMIWTKR